jgi:hypothetical protein
MTVFVPAEPLNHAQLIREQMRAEPHQKRLYSLVQFSMSSHLPQQSNDLFGQF